MLIQNCGLILSHMLISYRNTSIFVWSYLSEKWIKQIMSKWRIMFAHSSKVYFGWCPYISFEGKVSWNHRSVFQTKMCKEFRKILKSKKGWCICLLRMKFLKTTGPLRILFLASLKIRFKRLLFPSDVNLSRFINATSFHQYMLKKIIYFPRSHWGKASKTLSNAKHSLCSFQSSENVLTHWI